MTLSHSEANKPTNNVVADMVTRRHDLKVWPVFFRQIREGKKRFEIRKDDREIGYRVGDTLVLCEWVPPMSYQGAPSVTQYAEHYTGERLVAEVTSILEGGQFGLEPGYVCMSIDVRDTCLHGIDLTDECLECRHA